jgi:hypothetical protein
MYKPPENHVSDIEMLVLEKLDSETLQKVNDDVRWMLQTDSYRFHYLDRLVQLEQRILEMLGDL